VVQCVVICIDMDDVSASVLGEVEYAGMLQRVAVCIHMYDVSASVLGEVEYAGMLLCLTHCVAVCCSVLLARML